MSTRRRPVTSEENRAAADEASLPLHRAPNAAGGGVGDGIIDSVLPLRLELPSWPAWMGPISFFATVGISIWFVPWLTSVILGLAVFILVEATLYHYKPTWLRPTTVIEPTADFTKHWFDQIGSWVAAAFDVAWWLDVVWRFLRRVLPLDAIWTATVTLLSALLKLITSPLGILVGFMRRITSSSNPVLSVIVIGLVGSYTVSCILSGDAPWNHWKSFVGPIKALWLGILAKKSM